MITEKKKQYNAPNVTVVAFAIESGFAGTPTPAPEQTTNLEGYTYDADNNNLTGYFN